ncbi:hypothetical protein [Cellulosilyticum ruminicola]|uniref:hypothetical protein n=1 Tax=Cellulosilyticum ruminicola TaxID=425254 RepID=UPI0006D0807D|nr:hypothetical protein [Cellulosilyticum ruminicola]
MKKVESVLIIGSLAIGGIIGFINTQFSNMQKSQHKVSSGNNIQQVISAQMNQSILSEEGNGYKAQENQKDKKVNETADEIEQVESEDIDIDLTQMNSDMVYATVYQFVMEPESYIGKKVKMTGTYYPVFDESIKNRYHCCMIKDAAACCAQGLEFIWDKGEHVYPDEYPNKGNKITVIGIFETYQEEGNTAVYCRLKDAQLNTF